MAPRPCAVRTAGLPAAVLMHNYSEVEWSISGLASSHSGNSPVPHVLACPIRPWSVSERIGHLGAETPRHPPMVVFGTCSDIIIDRRGGFSWSQNHTTRPEVGRSHNILQWYLGQSAKYGGSGKSRAFTLTAVLGRFRSSEGPISQYAPTQLAA